LATDRDIVVAHLDKGYAVEAFSDHEARVEEKARAVYLGEIRFGSLEEEANAAFTRWRATRLGQPVVASQNVVQTH